MNSIYLQNAGVFSVPFTLRKLVGISCLLALVAFPSLSFAASRITNVSTRANVGKSNNVVILGTILQGSGSATLIFRGIGPSLAQYFPGTLADPLLEIKDANGTVLAFNNNWQDDPAQAADIQAAGLAPSNANESAYRIVVGPGTYYAVLSGYGGGTGIGVVEVYDITSQPSSIKLANVSTRAKAGTGNNAEIFGITIQGGNKSLGLRGIGPTLAQFFSGTLPNPALSLMSGGSQLQYNQNWKDSEQYEIINYGLAPPNDLESAMVTNSLNDGAYTVVMDTSGATGISSIEAYDLGDQLLVSEIRRGGAGYCNEYENSVLAESSSFTLPVGTPLVAYFGAWSSEYPWCVCSQPGTACGAGHTWSANAVLLDRNFNVVATFNGGISPTLAHCSYIPATSVTATIPPGATPPYKLRLRATGGAFCNQGGMGIYVENFSVNVP